MVSVLLSVLKIVGIVLVVILLVVLLVVLAILFIPIRYKVIGNKGEAKEDYKIEFKASWFLHIISVKVFFGKGKLEKRIKLLFFDLLKDDKGDKRKKHNKRKKCADSSRDIIETEICSEPNNDESSEDKLSKDESGKDELSKDKSFTAKDNACESNNDKLSEGNLKADKQGTKNTTDNYVDSNDKDAENENVFLKIRNKFCGIISKIREVIGKLRYIYADFDYYKQALFDDERNGHAISKLIVNIKKLIKAVMPKKIKGYIEFGFDDPATTGKLLSFAALIYPWIFGKIQIEPDFEEEKLLLDINARGRIFVISLVVIGIKVYFDKEIKRFIRIMKKEKENGK